jgi:hypothetical protein
LAGVLTVVSSSAHAQNLLANPGFDQSLAGWTLFEGNATTQWNAADSNGSTHSGSVRSMLPGGVPQGSFVVFQCVPVSGNGHYDFSVKARLQQIGLQVGSVDFYGAASCAGNSFLTGDSIYGDGDVGQPNVWVTVDKLFDAPAAAHSAIVALVVTTRFNNGTAHTAFLDDAYFGPAAPSTCIANNQTLCLDYQPGDGRFLVRATYATVQSGGLQGNANAISLSGLGVNRGGVLWFFSADNPEVLVKVLNGCGSTGFLWVFISAGTNVGMNLFIADTDTGAVALFHNPDLGPFPAIQNIFAINCYWFLETQ